LSVNVRDAMLEGENLQIQECITILHLDQVIRDEEDPHSVDHLQIEGRPRHGEGLPLLAENLL